MTYSYVPTRRLNDTAGSSVNLVRGGAGPGGGPRRAMSGLGGTDSPANAAVRAVQAAANRFSGVGSFDPIAVDGGMGGDTENAVQNALVVAAGQGAATAGQIPDSIAASGLLAGFNAAFGGGVTGAGQTFIMQNVSAITSTLTSVANAMGLPAEIKPSIITTAVKAVTNAISGGPKAPTAPGAAPAAGSLTDVVKNMPTAMKLTLAGLGLGIGYFAFFDKKKSRRK